jgi:hypothetical protein
MPAAVLTPKCRLAEIHRRAAAAALARDARLQIAVDADGRLTARVIPATEPVITLAP